MPSRPDSPITHIQVEPTTRCNLSCVSCIKPVYDPKWMHRTMGVDRLDRILDNSPAISSVHLQGWGEPLLHPELPAMIRACKTRGLRVSFTTNGSVMDRGMAAGLVEAGLDAVTFSMAGGCAATQDAIRGEGSFEQLKTSIAVFLAQATRGRGGGPKVAVSYLLTPETITELPRVVRWCRTQGIHRLDTVHLTQAVHSGQEDLQGGVPTMGRTHKWVRFWSNFLALGSRRFSFSLRPFCPEPLPVCDRNPMATCFVSGAGEVSPCVFLNPPVAGGIRWKKSGDLHFQAPVVFGNLEQENLGAIYRSAGYTGFRRSFEERMAIYSQALGRVGFGMEGSQQLERACGLIRRGFETHPPPAACRCCWKLEGF